jgi:hypothetical protein
MPFLRPASLHPLLRQHFQPPFIYFNFALDTVYLPGALKAHIPHFFVILSDSRIEKLEYLAISAAIFHGVVWTLLSLGAVETWCARNDGAKGLDGCVFAF